MSARDLVYKTRIPIGSIYDFLNELVNYKLINVTTSGANKYYIDDFEKQVVEFVDNSFKNSLSIRENLLKLVSQNKREKSFEAYGNYDKFRLDCFKISPKPSRLMVI